jgi:hypothetical protein
MMGYPLALLTMLKITGINITKNIQSFKAVLPADSDEYIMVEILGTFQTSARTYVPHSFPQIPCN